jgi:hypothetical protein
LEEDENKFVNADSIKFVVLSTVNITENKA